MDVISGGGTAEWSGIGQWWTQNAIEELDGAMYTLPYFVIKKKAPLIVLKQ